jgi:signal transduction histidine kinase
MPFTFQTTFIMLTQFVVLSQDHAETRRRARELEAEILLHSRLSERKNRFLMNMNHEMKTPLAAMSMSAQAAEELLRGGGDMGEVYTMLGAVRIEANRSARLMGAALSVEMAQSTHGGMSELDIGALIKKRLKITESWRSAAAMKIP